MTAKVPLSPFFSARFLLAMPPRIPISSLINPPTLCLPPAILDQQAALTTRPGPTAHHSQSVDRLSPDPPIRPIQPQQSPKICRNVYTSSKTTLSVLYTYEDVNAWVEYPETSPDQPIGYLFCRDPRNWENPVRNFAYSLGKPSGQTEQGQERKHPLLVDQQGIKVPCVVSHLTCMDFAPTRSLYCTKAC
jgi:hypothetical protein